MDEVDEILSMVEEPAAEEEASVEDVGLEAASDQLIAAVEAGDRAGVKAALKSAFDVLFEARSMVPEV